MQVDPPGSREHVDAVRADFAAQLQTYRDLVAAASKASGMSLVRIDAALAAFETGYFNSLLVALAARFAPRADQGGPLDEVRLLVDSITRNRGVMAAGPSAAYDPGKSVLKHDAGDRIALNADDFEAIAAAYLRQMELKPA